MLIQERAQARNVDSKTRSVGFDNRAFGAQQRVLQHIRGRTGKHVLGLSLSGFDPTETCAAQDFRSAKVLFVPSLKRDIFPSIACTRPPARGSHGNPHPTARIHIHTWRRSSCVAARSARAAAGKGPRIGFLGAASASGYARQLEGFRLGLRDLGYVEGTNIVIEYRWAQGKYEHLRELAAELIRSNVDVIVTHGTPGALPPSKRTRRFPSSWPWWEIRSLRASLPAWRGRVEISPDRAFSPRNSRRREYSFSSS